MSRLPNLGNWAMKKAKGGRKPEENKENMPAQGLQSGGKAGSNEKRSTHITPMASSQADKHMDVDTAVEIKDKTPPESAVPVFEIEDETLRDGAVSALGAGSVPSEEMPDLEDENSIFEDFGIDDPDSADDFPGQFDWGSDLESNKGEEEESGETETDQQHGVDFAAGPSAQEEPVSGSVGHEDIREATEEYVHTHKEPWHDINARHPPSIAEAKSALADIKKILRPPHKTGNGYKDPVLDVLTQTRIEQMKMLLWIYTDESALNSLKIGRGGSRWTAASLHVAHTSEKGPWAAHKVREWTQAFIADRKELPFNVYGTRGKSRIDDEDLAQEIHLHLQSVGEYARARDICDSRPGRG
ncbi:hypothetical protein PTI98_011428 [Pleurotus ostreatus]|nr:hypothetical protein PTI98_011428 [Pleurotus ostreatus]